MQSMTYWGMPTKSGCHIHLNSCMMSLASTRVYRKQYARRTSCTCCLNLRSALHTAAGAILLGVPRPAAPAAAARTRHPAQARRCSRAGDCGGDSVQGSHCCALPAASASLWAVGRPRNGGADDAHAQSVLLQPGPPADTSVLWRAGHLRGHRRWWAETGSQQGDILVDGGDACMSCLSQAAPHFRRDWTVGNMDCASPICR